MDLKEYLERQKRFSQRAFGDGTRAEGICKHIEKELAEIRANPTDPLEWIDVAILALDGAWRAGYEPKAVAEFMELKQTLNMNRHWPAPGGQDQPVEHIKAT
jgi:hypothetical protein